MILFLITLTIIVAGLIAIECGQAPRPRAIPIWNDDVERRYLRGPAGPRYRR